MEKHIKKWFSIVFCALLILTMTICLAKPASSFSESENKTLTQLPKFSFESIWSGKYMENLENFSTDQFPWRDYIVSLKAQFEKTLGKKESGGVYFADDDYLIEKPVSTDLKITTSNLSSLKKLDASGKYNISLMLVPTAYEVLSDKLPYGAYTPIQNQAALLADEMLSQTNVNFIDPAQALKQHSDEYIYFRTDHHQTAYGSYLSYKYLCEKMGITPYNESDFTKTDLSDEFVGTMWSKAPLFNFPGDTISIYEPKFDIDFEVNYVVEEKISDSFYEKSRLEEKDKYSMFLDGNHSIISIKSSNKNGKKLAVFKDSYANSILPLLANHYEEIHVLDLRYYNMNPLLYLEENDISDILVLYNTSNFITDANPVKLSAFIK